MPGEAFPDTALPDEALPVEVGGSRSDCVFLSRREPPTTPAQSAKGTSTVIPSLATAVSLKTSRASFTSSSALMEYRAET